MKQALYFAFTLLLFVSCKPSDARRPITNNSGSSIEASIERNKQLNEKEYAQIKALIKASKKSFLSSEYGFWYAYNTKIEQKTITPKFGDLVHYNAVLKTLADQIIYSESAKKIQTYYIDQQELFSGLREGLKLMKEGESVTFMFPSQQVYGYYGDDNKIGSNVPLICEVSLLKLTTN